MILFSGGGEVYSSMHRAGCVCIPACNGVDVTIPEVFTRTLPLHPEADTLSPRPRGRHPQPRVRHPLDPEANTPPSKMTIEADGTYPTGMRSGLIFLHSETVGIVVALISAAREVF